MSNCSRADCRQDRDLEYVLRDQVFVLFDHCAAAVVHPVAMLTASRPSQLSRVVPTARPTIRRGTALRTIAGHISTGLMGRRADRFDPEAGRGRHAAELRPVAPAVGDPQRRAPWLRSRPNTGGDRSSLRGRPGERSAPTLQNSRGGTDGERRLQDQFLRHLRPEGSRLRCSGDRTCAFGARLSIDGLSQNGGFWGDDGGVG